MSKRLYVGKLPSDARPEDVKSFFDGYGAIVDCRILTGFGFIEFETEKDAEDVVRNFNGKNFMGSEIIVEQAKDSRPKRGYEDRGGGGGGGYRGDRGEGGYRGAPGGGGGGGRGPRAPGIRLVVTGVSRDTSWQDLKDFARQAGNVTFADIDRDVANQGVVEYATREEADQAIRDLDGKEIRGTSVRVALDDRRGAVGGGYSRGGDRYGGSDRHGGGAGGYGSGRRDRSRSPRRYEERRRYDDGERRRDDRYEERDRGEERRREDRGDRERRERY